VVPFASHIFTSFRAFHSLLLKFLPWSQLLSSKSRSLTCRCCYKNTEPYGIGAKALNEIQQVG
jgi:hypothetical protein